MHRKKLEQIYEEFQSTPAGLTTAQAMKQQKIHGQNTIKTKKRRPIIFQILSEFTDLMTIILIVATALAYAFGRSSDAIIIFLVVILNVFVSFIQKYKAEKAIEALKSLISPHTNVLRDGAIVHIEVANIVPGDIIIINEGDRIPADARLIEAHDLKCDESILTGESVQVSKESITLRGKFLPKIEHSNTIFMGTTVSHGSGRAIVFATGDKTELGKIALLTTRINPDKSPLEKELKKIGFVIAITTIILSISLFAVGYFIQGKSFIENLLFTVSVAVAAVPEGLPTTITIALALGVQRLAHKRAIVKKLSSVETLGSTTVILSDKTGTITKDEMTIQEVFFNNLKAEVHGVGYTPKGSISIKTAGVTELVIGTDDPILVEMDQREKDLKNLQSEFPKIYKPLNLIAAVGKLCNDASLNKKDSSYSITGDPTEASILTFIEKAGFDTEKIANTYSIITKIPFDSERKRMTVVAKDLHTREIFTFTKGAPNIVLDRCTRIMLNGEKVDLTKELREMIKREIDNMAEKALRVISFAYKEMPLKEKDSYTEAAAENNLIFLGIAGMMDPPRREIKEAIALTKDAGIKTYIVTGDYGLTAAAVAKNIGLITSKNYEIITGEDLNRISDQKLKKILKDKTKEIIFARVSPQHKLKLVNTLKELGEIIAVTGDGVNDAPALKRADIGVAMGIKGTDVSKEAAVMVLTDDSFGSIVRAIEEGRTIYQNMQKFIMYIFSGNIAEMFIIFFAIALNLPTPLSAVLILLINVGTDLLPALALGMEPAERGIMSNQPRDPRKRIMNKSFIAHFVYLGVFMGTIALGTFIWNLYRYGWSYGDSINTASSAYTKSATIIFAIIVVIQMMNTYNIRSKTESIFSKSLFKNAHLFFAVLISVGLLYFITESKIAQSYLNITHLTWTEWKIVIVTSLSVVIVEEARKAFLRLKKSWTILPHTSESK